MTLQGLIATLSRASTFDNALAFANRDVDFSLTEGLRAPLLAALLEQRTHLGKAPALLLITATGRESESLHENLACFAADAEIIDFPAWETLPHERLSPSAEIVGKRLYALRRMREWEESAADARRPLIVIASVRAALQPVADNLTDYEPIDLVAGQRGHDLSAIARQLVDVAYARVDMVTRRG